MKFKSYINLKSPIVIKFLDSIIKNLEEVGINPDSLRKELSGARDLLISNGIYGSDDTLYIYTDQVKLLLKLDDNNNQFIITGVYPNEFSTRSAALKRTAILEISDENSVLIPNNPNDNTYFYHGELVKLDKRLVRKLKQATSPDSSRNLLNDLKAFATKRTQSNGKNKNSKPTISKELEELLDQTREIIDVYEEFDRAKAVNSEKVNYRKIYPSSNRTNDKPHYVLETGVIDYAEYRVNSPIKIQDKFGNYLVAQVADYLKQDNEHELNLIEIMFEDQIDFNSLNLDNSFFIKFPSSVIANAQRRAVEDIRSGRTKAKYIDKAIVQGKPEKFKRVSIDKIRHDNLSRERKLNESQLKAISNGIDSKDIYLVMGPPGTGKTSVIAEWVKYFTNEGMRVLISSQNNAAVDNVLKKLIDEENIEILRIGKELKVDSSVLPYTLPEKLRNLRDSLVYSADQTINDLEELELKVTQLRTELDYMNLLTKNLEIAQNSFDSYLINHLIPLKTELSRKLDEYSQVELRKERLLEQIQELKQPKQTGILRKISNFLIEDTSELKLKHLCDSYEQADHEKWILKKQIEDLKLKLKPVFVHLDKRLNMIEKLESKLNQLKEKIVKTSNLNNEFDLYNDENLLFSQDLKVRDDYIISETRRLKNLKEVYKNWEDEVKKEQNYGLNSIILESSNVVGSTCIGINSQYEFHDLEFDVSIIDEAGQIQIQNALIPMSASEKLIMLGDYNQIPPVVDEELKNMSHLNQKLLNTSLFELIYKKIDSKHKSMLDIQYRIPSSIAETVSDFFYDGQYKSSLNKQKASKLSILPQFDTPYVFIDTSDSISRFENGQNLKGYENKYEANIICNLVGGVLKNNYVKPEEIGIISAYKEQIKTIRSLLEQKNIITDQELLDSMVNTLDSFQGQERDLILYSFVRSKRRSRPFDKRIGFLKETRRLNVAMTRAKQALILIGDTNYLTNCLYQERDENGNIVPETDERQFSQLVGKIVDDVKTSGTCVTSLEVLDEF